MNLSSPFIKRPIMTTLLMAAILLFGVLSYNALPVSDLPNVDYPTIEVTAQQPGGSPEYMANLIATPLERNCANISGLNTMTSNSRVGNSQIVLNFDLGVDLNSKEVEVEAAITKTLPDLPPMPYNPSYQKVNPASIPVLFILLTSSSQSLSNLYEVGYNILAQPLSMIQGVSQVAVYGLPYAVRVQADPMKLMGHQIDLNTLALSLRESNPNLPSGLIQGYHTDYILNSDGMLTEGSEYDKVIIKENQNTPLFIEDVATGLSALEQRNPYFRYITSQSDENMVVLGVTRLPGSNTIDIIDSISKKLPDLEKSIPGSISLSYFYDQGKPIIASVREVELTLVIALALVVSVIFLYLGKLRETIIPCIVLPMAIVATFIIMFLLGFNLDTLSLLALVLSIGFVIDDSVVVLENIIRHSESGKNSYDSAMDGSKQISVTVFTMSLALSAIFIPFIWMPGILGRLFHEFSLTIIIAIYCSGFISLTLNPMLCSRYLKAASKQKKKPNLSERCNAWLVERYTYLLNHSIRLKKTTLLVGILCLVLSFVMIKILPTDFLPPSNEGLIQALTQCQDGSSKVNTIRHQKQFNKIILQNPYQNGFLTFVGYTEDDQGMGWVRLIDAKKRPDTVKVARELFRDLSTIPGMNVFLRPIPMINLQVGSTTSLGEFQYSLYSSDSETLYKTAALLTQKMKEMPELMGVNSDMRINSPQLNIQIDRDRAGTYGITAKKIESTLQYAYSGGRISTFNRGINLYDLIVEVAPGFDLTTTDLDLLYIKAETTQELVPLSSVASWKALPSPSSINHINTFPSVTISFNLVEGATLGGTLKKIDQIAKEIIPENVTANVQGAASVFIDTFKAMKWLFVIAIIVIYLLLGILYESFIHPFTILSALPVAALGGLIALWLFGLSLSLYSIVGMIVLIGLVQKNGIMMIDFALEFLQQPGETPVNAITEACRARFRPILMTTIAAMMGALPIAIGIGESSDANRPLGIVVFGGLIFSQLITLFVTPIVFLYMQQFQDFLKGRKKNP
ncbi:MAG: efflux RND transporter permease subunit [Chlamydiales bacterium]